MNMKTFSFLNAVCVSLCFSRSSVIVNILCTVLLEEVFAVFDSL